jgi:hypothetical protein
LAFQQPQHSSLKLTENTGFLSLISASQLRGLPSMGKISQRISNFLVPSLILKHVLQLPFRLLVFPVCGVLLGCVRLCALFTWWIFSLKNALLKFCFRDKVCNFFSNVYSFTIGDFHAGVWCIIAGAGAILLGCVMLPAWNTLYLTGLCCFFFR